MKPLFLDLETNGTDKNRHDLWHLAAIIPGPFNPTNADAEISLKSRPYNVPASDPVALDIGGITQTELKALPDPHTTISEFTGLLCKCLEDPDDRFTLIGYNILGFDKDFLFNWFKRNGYFFGSYFSYYVIDVYAFIQALHQTGVFPGLPKLKLEVVCEYLGIPIQAHNPISDIRATRPLPEIR